MSKVLNDHRKRYMDYSTNTTSALAHNYKEFEALAKEAYGSSEQLRKEHYCKNQSGDINTISSRMGAVGDRLSDFAEELKCELRGRYTAEYELDKAIDAEIVDEHDLHHSDHFDNWIDNQLIE